MSAVIIRPECWRQRYTPSRAEQIYVSPLPGSTSWQVWWWSTEYELGIQLGDPVASSRAAAASASEWAEIYSCPWGRSPRVINYDGEMSS